MYEYARPTGSSSEDLAKHSLPYGATSLPHLLNAAPYYDDAAICFNSGLIPKIGHSFDENPPLVGMHLTMPANTENGAFLCFQLLADGSLYRQEYQRRADNEAYSEVSAAPVAAMPSPPVQESKEFARHCKRNRQQIVARMSLVDVCRGGLWQLIPVDCSLGLDIMKQSKRGVKAVSEDLPRTM
jgi:hypothetical protein